MLTTVFKNTDDERCEILKICSKFISLDIELGSNFSGEIKSKVNKYLDVFDKIKAYDTYLVEEAQKQEKEFLILFEKASLFVRHYFITMHMAIERGELPVNTTNYYEFKYPFGIPEFKSDVQLIRTAQKLFEDDLKRTSDGGKYFTNPSIGAVKVWVEKFIEAVEHKNNKYNVKRGEVENIDNIRKETDELLQKIFELVLTKIGADSDDEEEALSFLSDCGFEIGIGENDKLQIMQKKIKDNNNQKTEKSSTTKPNQLKFNL